MYFREMLFVPGAYVHTHITAKGVPSHGVVVLDLNSATIFDGLGAEAFFDIE